MKCSASIVTGILLLRAHEPRKRSVTIWMFCMLSVACGRPATERPRPDVVLVVIDTLRADHLPFYPLREAHVEADARSTEPRRTRAKAPFLSELASESLLFERAWAASSWTTPSMASLFTSVYPDQHNLWVGMATMDAPETSRSFATRLPSALQTIPEFMRSIGYRTFGISDNPHICELEGFEDGFDRFQNFDYAGAEAVNEALDGWKEEIEGSEPSFVFLHYMDPHAPYHRRKPWFERHPEGTPEALIKRSAYDSEIEYVDSFLREAFAMLGVGPETLVIFTADHGEEFGDHGGWSHLFQLYSELTHVPLLIRAPGGASRSGRVRANVSLLDILPTLRDLLGSAPHPQDAGQSLEPYLTGTDLDAEARADRHVFSMRIADRSTKRAVVHGDFKLIETRSSADPTAALTELYDLAHDPLERRNLSETHRDVVQRLSEELHRFLESAPTWEPEAARGAADPAKLESLRHLGYTGQAETELENQ